MTITEKTAENKIDENSNLLELIFFFPRHIDNIIKSNYSKKYQLFYQYRYKEKYNFSEIRKQLKISEEKANELGFDLFRILGKESYLYLKDIDKNLSNLFSRYGNFLHFNIFFNGQNFTSPTEEDRYIISFFLEKLSNRTFRNYRIYFNIDWDFNILYRFWYQVTKETIQLLENDVSYTKLKRLELLVNRNFSERKLITELKNLKFRNDEFEVILSKIKKINTTDKINDVLSYIEDSNKIDLSQITYSQIHKSVISIFSTTMINKNTEEKLNFNNIIDIVVSYIISKYLEKTDKEKYILKGFLPLNNEISYNFRDLYPKGVHVYKSKQKIVNELRKRIKSLKDKSDFTIIRRITDLCEEILLWGPGFYIHKSQVKFDKSTLNDIVNKYMALPLRTISISDINNVFIERKDVFISSLIPTPQALYSLLKNDKRVTIEAYPRDCYDKIGDDKKTFSKIINRYFRKKKTFVVLEELKTYFCEERGWAEEYLIYNLDSIKEIIHTDKGYIHLNYFDYDHEKLKIIINYIEKEIELIKGFIHIRKIRGKYGVSWYDVCHSDVHPELMGSILMRYEHRNFDIEKRVYALPRDFEAKEDLNFSNMISKLLLERKDFVNYNEIKAFLEKRGLSINLRQILSKTNVLKYYQDSYIHPKVIGYEEDMLDNIEEILEEAALISKNKGSPYTNFTWILENYQKSLPSLKNNFDWTIELLASISNKLDSFMIFSGVYVPHRNMFNVEDFDDLVAFIIAKDYENGICKITDIERKLQSYEIISIKSNLLKYSTDLFFQGSSVELVDDNNNIRLSKIGRERYLRYV